MHMNRIMSNRANLLDLSLNLRAQVLDAIGDADLAYTLPGNPSLGEVIADFGRVEAAYTAAFRGLPLRFDQPVPSFDTVAALKDWFATLDDDLVAALSALSDEELGRPIDRGQYSVPTEIVFYTFREAVLVFATKASLYLRALGKVLPEQIQGWVG
jgi:hypothetical protein